MKKKQRRMMVMMMMVLNTAEMTELDEQTH